MSDAVLSPSGRHVAATAPANGRRGLVVIDLSVEPFVAKGLIGHADADVVGVRWVNDERIVYSLSDRDSSWFEAVGQGLFAIDRRGTSPPRVLIKRTTADEWGLRAMGEATRLKPQELGLPPDHRLHSTLSDGSADVIVQKYNHQADWELVNTELLRVNTVTGRHEFISGNAPDGAQGWTLDRFGVPRLVRVETKDLSRLLWRDSPQSAWSVLSELPRYELAKDGRAILGVVGIAADDRVYVHAADRASGDISVLSVLNMKERASRPAPLLSTPGFDFRGSLVWGPGGQVVGVHYLTDARGTHWIEPGLKAIQEQVDKLLPNTINLLDCGRCDSPAAVLVRSYADTSPATYRIYRVQSGKLEGLASSRPWIDPRRAAKVSFERIKARDGLEIPLHVTLPPQRNGPAPMVVLVHGGPHLRGAEWQWSGDAQFLASRGYVVVEPEFRGSTGFGSRLYRAGWKQWGLAMQDDIADATRWAVDKGFADPKRICIAGGSYGGYATLMGLIRYPDLYRCGVEWFGVSDIELLYTHAWSDLSSDYRTFGLPLLVGDRVKDAAQLQATSPLRQHARITQPLLMVHGGLDTRVPIEHGKRLADALSLHNPRAEWVSYADEGHGFAKESNEIEFWTRVEKFLDKHLKNPN